MDTRYNDQTQTLTDLMNLLNKIIDEVNDYLKEKKDSLLTSDKGRRDDIIAIYKELMAFAKNRNEMQLSLDKVMNENNLKQTNHSPLAKITQIHVEKNMQNKFSNLVSNVKNKLANIKTGLLGRSKLRDKVLANLNDKKVSDLHLGLAYVTVPTTAPVTAPVDAENLPKSDLENLPEELIIKILSYADLPGKYASVSTLFNSYTKDEQLWREHIAKDFGIQMEEVQKSAKDATYQDMYKRLLQEKKNTCVVMFPGIIARYFDPHLVLNRDTIFELNRYIYSSAETAHYEEMNMCLSRNRPHYLVELNIPHDQARIILEKKNFDTLAKHITEIRPTLMTEDYINRGMLQLDTGHGSHMNAQAYKVKYDDKNKRFILEAILRTPASRPKP